MARPSGAPPPPHRRARPATPRFTRRGSPLCRRYTIENNLGATHNALCAIVESGLDVHLVHLGTMGVYGYGNSGGEIPEGYIDVELPGGRQKNILHPAYPGSVYHATKPARGCRGGRGCACRASPVPTAPGPAAAVHSWAVAAGEAPRARRHASRPFWSL